jgi:hypothetical protein
LHAESRRRGVALVRADSGDRGHSGRMGRPRKQWEALRPAQRRTIVVLGVVTSVLQLVMLWDLRRRPADQIRGPKRAWVAASFVRPLGQIAYVLWGRRPPADQPRPA